MAGLAKMEIIGYLGKDPDCTSNEDGEVTSARFSVAVTEKWKDKEGEQHEQTEWFTVVAFRGLSFVVSEYLVKGSRVYVEGKYRTHKYIDKLNEERISRQIVAQNLVMLGGKRKSDNDSPDSGSSDNFNPGDDDIPY